MVFDLQVTDYLPPTDIDLEASGIQRMKIHHVRGAHFPLMNVP